MIIPIVVIDDDDINIIKLIRISTRVFNFYNKIFIYMIYENSYDIVDVIAATAAHVDDDNDDYYDYD